MSLKGPKSGRIEIVDQQGHGLTIRVAADGNRSWAVRYSPKGMGQRRATIGTYPAKTLAGARTRALEIAAAAKRGIDLPATEARLAATRRHEVDRPETVAQLTAHYIEDYAKANQRRWKLTQRIFQMHVDPAIGRISLAALRRADVVALLDDLQNQKKLRAQVNRVRSQIIAALNWAVEHEWIVANPAVGVRKKRVETPRSRVLDDRELRALWRAADSIGYPGGDLIKALMLSGQRRDEVRCISFSELRDDGALWVLPAGRNKGKRDHMVPLSGDLRRLFESVPRISSFIFSTGGKKAYAGTRRLKEIVDKKSGVTGWTFHDLRRTASTRMSELGIGRDVVRQVLNHARPGLDRVYDAHDYFEEKRRALEAWAERLDAIVAGGDAPTKVRRGSD